MAQKNTFSPEMVIAMEKIKEAAETMKIHVENSRPYFENIFNLDKSNNQEVIVDGRDRVAGYITKILPEHSAHTELLYCIKASLVKLQTQIFINKSHPKIGQVKEAAKKYIAGNSSTKLGHRPHKDGFVILMDRKIYDLINDEEADDKIKNWFIESFYEFSGFFKATPELGWISPLLDRDIFYEYEEFLRSEKYSPSTIHSYTLLARQFTESGWKADEWGELDVFTTNKDTLQRMQLLTFGDHGLQFKGKTNFRRFLDQKLEEQELVLTSD